MTLREKTEDVPVWRSSATLPPALRKALYITDWIIDECDEDHRNIDPRDLHFDDLLDMTETALTAWDSGAR
jgi:hypothetical protein